ncbi:hypothetical protein [Archangium sp.]|uniref:hypothetical protein n=1 Tax=Archangium sp. TaxID=1872627 RepID=UPI002869ECD8|nr:hypothetical protein [Archangium sp.]
MTPREAVGLLVELQIWGVRELPAGRFQPLPTSAGRPADASADRAVWVRALERAVYWTGAPGAAWEALMRAGVLVDEGDTVRLALADRYVQALEKRAREAERKRLARSRAKGMPSGGRPADVRPQKRREEIREESFPAAAGGEGASRGCPVAVPPPPPVDASEDGPPTQRALPGTHLVPARPPREEAPRATHEGPGAPEGAPDAVPAPAGALGAQGLFQAFQDERQAALPGLPREPKPKGWEAWYRAAVEELGDEAPLREALPSYMADEWARGLKPPCPASAFISPKVWPRHVPTPAEAPSVILPPPAAVDTSTEWGRAWQACLDELATAGRSYALKWLPLSTPVGFADGELLVECPDGYFRDWVSEHYGDMVAGVARTVGLEGVRWVVAGHTLASSA